MAINDPRWGRGQDESTRPETPTPEDNRPDPSAQDSNSPQPSREDSARQPRRRSGDNDLDELWNEFNQTLKTLLNGGKEGGPQQDPQGERKPPVAHPPKMGTGRLMGMVGALALAWLGSGFYIVPEGQIGVVTTFGQYTKDAQPGFSWRMPWPVQDAELVDVSSVRTAEIGIRGSQRLREALMLTDDENIVDVQFNVQYRIKVQSAKDYLFRTRQPDQTVTQAAESAMREVVGRKAMDSVLFESKQEIAENVRTLMQEMLDRYQTGIEVMSVAIQNAQPPEQVQAAFNDAVKAGQDRERQINEGQAYANAVIPKANGLASRLKQEAQGYKSRVVETAQGDADRFNQVFAQYEKAPTVTRDRLYIDTMKDVYTNANKVFVDMKSGNPLLYLPFDKLMEKSAAPVASTTTASTAEVPEVHTATTTNTTSVQGTTELDARTLLRLRGR